MSTVCGIGEYCFKPDRPLWLGCTAKYIMIIAAAEI